MPQEASPGADARPVLVCGLGRLGRHCVQTLATFGVPLRVVDLSPREQFDPSAVPSGLDRFCAGDCRSPQVLTSAGVGECRTVIVATGAERVNVAAAVAVRSLNPRARIIIRSAQSNLNRLLGDHLGDFVAFEPTAMAAPAFALAGLGEDTLGLLRLGGELVRVSRWEVVEESTWIGRKLYELGTSQRRILAVTRADSALGTGFGDWDPETEVRAGDVLTCVELGAARLRAPGVDGLRRETSATAAPHRTAAQIWRATPRVARVALLATLVNATVYLVCALLFRWHYPEIGAQDALNVAMVLILGGYDNLFGQLKVPFPIPAWLHVVSVVVSVCGTVGIGIVYAFITERVLSARFQLFRSRTPMPREGHAVVIGLGPLATATANFFAQLKHPVILVSPAQPDPEAGPGVAVLIGDTGEAMKRARVSTARSVVAVGDDDVSNLEAVLAARALDRRPVLVVRSDDARFRESVVRLLTGTRALGLPALAAEAFAATALGDHVHGLLHVDDRTLLVVEFRVEAGDGLCGRLIGEVASGYASVPLLWRRSSGHSQEFLPSDDMRLREADALVLIATIEGLRAIERREPSSPPCRIEVHGASSPEAAFDAALTSLG